MPKPTSDIIQIINAGSNVILNKAKPTSDLVQIATAAKRMGVQVTMRGFIKPTSDWIAIAKAGGKNVTIDLG